MTQPFREAIINQLDRVGTRPTRPRRRRGSIASTLGIGALVGASPLTALATGTVHAAGTVTFADGALTVTGDDAANRLIVGSATQGLITLNGVVVLGGQATLANVEVIGIDGGAGNDNVRIDESNGLMPAAKLTGGPGNDQLVGGSRDDILDGADGADSILGNAGDDRIDGGAGNDKVAGGPGADTVDLGPDSDEFTWSSGDGQDVLHGGAQTDTLRITGHDGGDSVSSNSDINDPSQAFFQFTEAGGASEFFDFTGFELLRADIGGGSDTASIGDLSTAGVQIVRLSLDPPTGSDGARDDVGFLGALFRVNRTRVEGSPSTRVAVADLGTTVLITGAEALTISGGVGTDVVDASQLAARTLELTEILNIGAAGDVLVGSPGDDTLIGGAGDDRIECRGGHDAVNGGGGHDAITC